MEVITWNMTPQRGHRVGQAGFQLYRPKVLAWLVETLDIQSIPN